MRPAGSAAALFVLLVLPLVGSERYLHPDPPHQEPVGVPAGTLQPLFDVPCQDGFAGPYPCRNVDLLAHLPLGQVGSDETLSNDIWGWTDPETGRAFALIGRTGGTAMVDVTNPESPIVMGRLPTHTLRSSWRDIKVYRDHAFIVSEARNHGLQIFDLTELRNVTAPPRTFKETAHYREGNLSNAHNIAVNEESGFAYVVGSNTCAGGLHMVDVRNPLEPVFAGCYSDDGYTHDVQCVVYQGPDGAYRGREICFASNEDTLTVVDVTDKAMPRQLSRTSYDGVGYTHQGWLTDDHMFFLLGDEGDEVAFGHGTRTYIWDVSDLDRPLLIGAHTSETAAVDHNLYIKGEHVYQANYHAGLRVLDLLQVAEARLEEVGFFDVYPEDDGPGFEGAWSVYPFFAGDVVVVSSIERGLFVLRPRLP